MSELPALATVDHLERRLGFAAPNNTRALELLAYASALVRAAAGRQWVNDENELEGVPAGIPDVVVAAVERAVQNPKGATQESAGPFSASWGPEAAQRIFLTRWDRRIIREAVRGGRSAAFTIKMAYGHQDEAE